MSRSSTTALLLAFSLAACGGQKPPTAHEAPRAASAPTASASAPEAHREQPPNALPAKESPFPPVKRNKLANGLSVEIVEAHALPIVQIRLLIHAGMGYGAAGGVANFTAEMLKEGGTRSMTSAQLLNRIETLGANLSVNVDLDGSTLGLAVTKQNVQEALTIVAELVTEPRFDETEFKKLKTRQIDEAQDNARSSGTWMATRAMFRELFAKANPYFFYEASPGELSKLTSAKVRDFHKRYYVPSNANVVLVGDVDASVTKLVDDAFSGWKGSDAPNLEFPPAIAIGKRRVVVAHRPKSVQSDIFVTSLIAPRKTPDWPAIRVANQVLGGGVASRLFLDVREQRSLAYSVRSQVMELAHGMQPLVLYAGTESSKTEQAVQGILDNLRSIVTAPITVAETETARRYLSDIFAIRMETVGSIADLLVLKDNLYLPDGYWDAYRAAVRKIDVPQASLAAARIAHPDQVLIVAAGDADVIATPLARFGEVTVLDPEQEFQAIRTIPEVAGKSSSP